MQQVLQKYCCGYELFGNRTKFAPAHKQEIEFGLSCMAIVTGGQHAAKASKKRCFGYELRGNSTTFAAAHEQEIEFGDCHRWAATIRLEIMYGDELHSNSQQQTHQILLSG